jgi:hypothetical protein
MYIYDGIAMSLGISLGSLLDTTGVVFGHYDLDVVWVVEHGPGGVRWLCMGALWEKASFVVHFWKIKL